MLFPEVFFSSKTDEWPTPRRFFEKLDSEFHFDLDPCSTHENATCDRHFTAEDDGLVQDWGQSRVFMNPPYGAAIGKWMRKALEASQRGALVVCLVPSRTDTAWWHNYAMRGEIRFIKGRLRFGDGEGRAPFPSAVVVFRPNNDPPR